MLKKHDSTLFTDKTTWRACKLLLYITQNFEDINQTAKFEKIKRKIFRVRTPINCFSYWTWIIAGKMAMVINPWEKQPSALWVHKQWHYWSSAASVAKRGLIRLAFISLWIWNRWWKQAYIGNVIAACSEARFHRKSRDGCPRSKTYLNEIFSYRNHGNQVEGELTTVDSGTARCSSWWEVSSCKGKRGKPYPFHQPILFRRYSTTEIYLCAEKQQH